MKYKFNPVLGSLDLVETDHVNLENIGTNTHAQIDTHIADNTIHFTEGSITHGNLSGLTADDHSQYILTDGTRAFTGNQSFGGFNITDINRAVITDSVDLTTVNAANGIALSIAHTASTAIVLPVAVASTIYTSHTTGKPAQPVGYFGGFKALSNGDVGSAYGIFADASVDSLYTPNIDLLVGIGATANIENASITYGAMSLYAAQPTINTGTSPNMWAAYFDGDVQISSNNKLYLKGSLISTGDTYIIYDSTGNTLDFFVDGNEIFNMSSLQAEFLKIINLSNITGNIFKFAADTVDPTGGGGAAAGRIPITIGGATKYLAYY